MCKQAIIRHRLDIQIHAVVRGVRRIARHQFANHCHHLLYIFGGVRDVCWSKHPKCGHGVEPDGLALVCDFVPGTILTVRPIDDFVVNIGDVGDETHRDTAPLHISTQNVIDQGGPAVAEVRGAVHGWAA